MISGQQGRERLVLRRAGNEAPNGTDVKSRKATTAEPISARGDREAQYEDLPGIAPENSKQEESGDSNGGHGNEKRDSPEPKSEAPADSPITKSCDIPSKGKGEDEWCCDVLSDSHGPFSSNDGYKCYRVSLGGCCIPKSEKEKKAGSKSDAPGADSPISGACSQPFAGQHDFSWCCPKQSSASPSPPSSRLGWMCYEQDWYANCCKLTTAEDTDDEKRGLQQDNKANDNNVTATPDHGAKKRDDRNPLSVKCDDYALSALDSHEWCCLNQVLPDPASVSDEQFRCYARSGRGESCCRPKLEEEMTKSSLDTKPPDDSPIASACKDASPGELMDSWCCAHESLIGDDKPQTTEAYRCHDLDEFSCCEPGTENDGEEHHEGEAPENMPQPVEGHKPENGTDAEGESHARQKRHFETSPPDETTGHKRHLPVKVGITVNHKDEHRNGSLSERELAERVRISKQLDPTVHIARFEGKRDSGDTAAHAYSPPEPTKRLSFDELMTTETNNTGTCRVEGYNQYYETHCCTGKAFQEYWKDKPKPGETECWSSGMRRLAGELCCVQATEAGKREPHKKRQITVVTGPHEGTDRLDAPSGEERPPPSADGHQEIKIDTRGEGDKACELGVFPYAICCKDDESAKAQLGYGVEEANCVPRTGHEGEFCCRYDETKDQRLMASPARRQVEGNPDANDAKGPDHEQYSDGKPNLAERAASESDAEEPPKVEDEVSVPANSTSGGNDTQDLTCRLGDAPYNTCCPDQESIEYMLGYSEAECRPPEADGSICCKYDETMDPRRLNPTIGARRLLARGSTSSRPATRCWDGKYAQEVCCQTRSLTRIYFGQTPIDCSEVDDRCCRPRIDIWITPPPTSTSRAKTTPLSSQHASHLSVSTPGRRPPA